MACDVRPPRRSQLRNRLMVPAWELLEPDCPVPRTHQALVEATQHLGLVGTGYHKPSLFLLHLNALLQALRNITFRLQAEKGKIPDFEAWYAEEQRAMRADALLVRFREARNKVVKESSLAPKSSFRSGLFRGRQMKFAAEYERPLMIDSAAELERLRVSSFATLILDKERSAIGEQLGVERTWVVEELGDGEVVSSCVAVLNTLGGLVSRAHARCGSSWRYEPIISDRQDQQELQVLLETDLDPSLSKTWGWDEATAELVAWLKAHGRLKDP